MSRLDRVSGLPLIAGVELGGTKCVCTLATGPDDVRDQRQVPTTDPQTTLRDIDKILARWWRDGGFAALGIASFGPLILDRQAPLYGHISNTTKPGWQEADIARRLSDPFPVPYALDTDVNGAAAAEMRWGIGRGLTDFAYVTVGTGVGVGLIVNGRSTRGLGHCEMGHLRVPTGSATAPSTCRFHRDCVEGLASGPAIERALGGRSPDSVSEDHPVWNQVVDALVVLAHALVVTTGPQRIAFGGGVMLRQRHLLPRLEPRLRASINGYLQIPDDTAFIVAPGLGDRAGPLGPIALGSGVVGGGALQTTEAA